MAGIEEMSVDMNTSPEAGDKSCDSELKMMESSPMDQSTGGAYEDMDVSEDIGLPLVSFIVIYNKQKYDVTFPLNAYVYDLKTYIEQLTNVPNTMQKLVFKGKLNNGETLRSSKILNGSKVMMIGSTVSDIMAVAAPDMKAIKEERKKEQAAGKEPLCKQKRHKAVLEKYGKPDDAMIGVRKKREPLPPFPLSGMYNKIGGKVRLTFKLDQEQLWIGTKDRTNKIPLGCIEEVVSEPLEGHEEYHLMGIQLGPTEASRYWVYWVPAQYIEAIKDAVYGKLDWF